MHYSEQQKPCPYVSLIYEISCYAAHRSQVDPQSTLAASPKVPTKCRHRWSQAVDLIDKFLLCEVIARERPPKSLKVKCPLRACRA